MNGKEIVKPYPPPLWPQSYPAHSPDTSQNQPLECRKTAEYRWIRSSNGREKQLERSKNHFKKTLDLVQSPTGDQRPRLILWIPIVTVFDEIHAGGHNVLLIFEVTLDRDRGDVCPPRVGAVIPE